MCTRSRPPVLVAEAFSLGRVVLRPALAASAPASGSPRRSRWWPSSWPRSRTVVPHPPLPGPWPRSSRCWSCSGCSATICAGPALPRRRFAIWPMSLAARSPRRGGAAADDPCAWRLRALPAVMRVAVVDYGSGNLTSAARALVAGRGRGSPGLNAAGHRHRRPGGGRRRRPSRVAGAGRLRRLAPPGWTRSAACAMRSNGR